MNRYQITEILKVKVARGETRISVSGDSMEPTLHSGDSVAICNRSAKFGDIAVIDLKEKGIVIHRVICCTNSLVVTKGDNCLAQDGVFEKSLIIGCLAHKPGETPRNSISVAIVSLVEAVVNMAMYATCKRRTKIFRALVSKVCLLRVAK